MHENKKHPLKEVILNPEAYNQGWDDAMKPIQTPIADGKGYGVESSDNQTDGTEKPKASEQCISQSVGDSASSPLPSCLNEIPNGEYDNNAHYECELEEGILCGRSTMKKDVQRLVCRDIIIFQGMKKLFEISGAKENNTAITNFLKSKFNITDAMIEEERRRGR